MTGHCLSSCITGQMLEHIWERRATLLKWCLHRLRGTTHLHLPALLLMSESVMRNLNFYDQVKEKSSSLTESELEALLG